MTCESLNDEQIAFAISKVGEWLCIREQEGHGGAGSPDPSHSALLYHLLQGKKPCDKPPPVIHSRPCHALANGEPVQLLDPPIPFPPGGDFSLLIAGNHQWKWENLEERILRHIPSDVLYHISRDNILKRHDS